MCTGTTDKTTNLYVQYYSSYQDWRRRQKAVEITLTCVCTLNTGEWWHASGSVPEVSHNTSPPLSSSPAEPGRHTTSRHDATIADRRLYRHSLSDAICVTNTGVVGSQTRDQTRPCAYKVHLAPSNHSGRVGTHLLSLSMLRGSSQRPSTSFRLAHPHDFLNTNSHDRGLPLTLVSFGKLRSASPGPISLF